MVHTVVRGGPGGDAVPADVPGGGRSGWYRVGAGDAVGVPVRVGWHGRSGTRAADGVGGRDGGGGGGGGDVGVGLARGGVRVAGVAAARLGESALAAGAGGDVPSFSRARLETAA